MVDKIMKAKTRGTFSFKSPEYPMSNLGNSMTVHTTITTENIMVLVEVIVKFFCLKICNTTVTNSHVTE